MMRVRDVIIIGAGVAGVTAANYCSRAGLDVTIVEKSLYGGQLNNTDKIHNYTGFSEVTGRELAKKVEEQAFKVRGLSHIYGDVGSVDKQGGLFEVVVSNEQSTKLYSKVVVIASGVRHKKLPIDSVNKLEEEGFVSYCPTCDGAFFEGLDVAVIGGGDSAVESALYLSNIARKVTVIHRRDEFRAEKISVDKMLQKDNIEIIYDSVCHGVHRIDDDSCRVSVMRRRIDNGWMNHSVDVDGLFVHIGIQPNTEFLHGFSEILDSNGFIETEASLATSVDGMFAIGDVRSDSIRQIVTATGDGAVASEGILKYIENEEISG